MLTGVNISKYNYKGIGFEDLIKRILLIDKDFRLRIASIEPDDFSDSFIQLFKNPKLAPHIHLCLQSGSNDVLKRMHRHYTREDFFAIAAKFRSIIPNFNITTDIIVGLPSETDEDFLQTLDAAERIGFGHIHVFKYSRRSGTKADTMENQVDEKVKNARSKQLRQLADRLTQNYLAKMQGTTQRILTETIENVGYI